MHDPKGKVPNSIFKGEFERANIISENLASAQKVNNYKEGQRLSLAILSSFFSSAEDSWKTLWKV